jgi:nitroreductase
MHQKPATICVTINELIQMRWSPRAFDPGKPISHDGLLALMEAARWSPSCFNDQPWRFVVCNKTTDEVAWQHAFATLVEKNQLWAKNAPVLILSVAMKNFNHNGKPNRWSMYDTGAACTSLSLQATAMGLSVHQMGGFNADLAREVFQLPDDCEPMAMMAVGYQAEVDVLDEDFKAAELSERGRAAVDERFYAGTWGEGYAVNPSY